MSRADRIVSRRRWVTEPKGYHSHAVKSGERHPSFQARKRKARIATGLDSTSTDMHHVHGKAI